MKFRRWFAVVVFKALTSVVCRIDDRQNDRVPDRGPLIIVMNHVNILEMPIIFTHLYPRPVTGFVRDNRGRARYGGFFLTCARPSQYEETRRISAPFAGGWRCCGRGT